jgi:glycosyltransferase involved in cell wall biosynthesis
MKILWAKAGRLLPVDTGGKIRSYNLLRHLAARHEVTLLSAYGGRRDEGYEAELQREFPGAVPVHTAAPDAGLLNQSLDYLRRLLSPAPYAVARYAASEVRHRIAALLGAQRFDIAVCDFLAPSLNFPRRLTTPTVLFQHNVESVLWRRQSQHQAGLIRRLIFRLEAAKMERYERAAVGRFHHVIAVSEEDRAQMLRMTAPERISVVPTGVELKQFQVAGTEATAPLVLFLGSMDWEANADGVEYFCRAIWPRVKSAVPEARFRIVGRNPQPRIRQLAGEAIEVTGTVSSVIEHLQEAAVFVVPLRIGGGTRLKIYEAMAAGRAIVSTSIGAEGLEVRHGRDILLADDESGFAEAVISLLRSPDLRRQLGQAAAAQAAQFDWSVVAAKFEQALTHAISSSPTALG